MKKAVLEQVALLQGQGINKIIALGHAGYTIDKQVAEIAGVDIVVGGHTETFLYTGRHVYLFCFHFARKSACTMTMTDVISETHNAVYMNTYSFKLFFLL